MGSYGSPPDASRLTPDVFPRLSGDGREWSHPTYATTGFRIIPSSVLIYLEKKKRKMLEGVGEAGCVEYSYDNSFGLADNISFSQTIREIIGDDVSWSGYEQGA
jgi:hypothetical protein